MTRVPSPMEARNEYVVPDGEDLGTRRWNAENPGTVRVVSASSSGRTERLDYMSWEFRRFKTRTTVDAFEFRGVRLVVSGQRPYVPGHPTAR